MPRVSKIMACMFCEEVPCVCGKPAKKPAPVRAVPDVHDEIAEGIAAFEAGRKASVHADVTEAVAAFTNHASPSPFASMGFVAPSEALAQQAKPSERTPDDQFKNALQVLAFARILHPESQRLAEQLAPRQHDPVVDAALTRWKDRREQAH